MHRLMREQLLRLLRRAVAIEYAGAAYTSGMTSTIQAARRASRRRQFAEAQRDIETSAEYRPPAREVISSVIDG